MTDFPKPEEMKNFLAQYEPSNLPNVANLGELASKRPDDWEKYGNDLSEFSSKRTADMLAKYGRQANPEIWNAMLNFLNADGDFMATLQTINKAMGRTEVQQFQEDMVELRKLQESPWGKVAAFLDEKIQQNPAIKDWANQVIDKIVGAFDKPTNTPSQPPTKE